MRRSRALRRLVGVGALAVLVYVVGFFGYGYTSGAAEYLSGQPRATDCETPGSRFGWAYEPVNYVPASDELANVHPDASTCVGRLATAGTDVVSPDGTHLAAWYIPREPRETDTGGAATSASGPTVVIVHGGKSNASGMLEYAAPLHAAYNLLLVDLRNSGRSGATQSTGGLREQDDLRAMLGWLERTKAPRWIAVLGNSNGAAAALAEARTDNRVRALILDSMHASLEWQIGNVIQTEKHLPAWPGAWGLMAGVEARLGTPVQSVDPIRTIVQVRDRPMLLTHGEADLIDRPADSLARNVAAARGAGIAIEVHTCPGAGHGMVVRVCATEWAGWVLTFLAANGGVGASA
jgi:pimeloyl-ACP methyl ester carboxylesterase